MIPGARGVLPFLCAFGSPLGSARASCRGCHLVPSRAISCHLVPSAMVHLTFLRALCEARRSAGDTVCGVLRHVELKDVEPCAICHEDMGTSDGTSDGTKTSGSASGEVGQLPCNHCFHKACLRQWLVLKRRCPLCNQTVPITGTGH
jgi:hypothetical protein